MNRFMFLAPFPSPRLGINSSNATLASQLKRPCRKHMCAVKNSNSQLCIKNPMGDLYSIAAPDGVPIKTSPMLNNMVPLTVVTKIEMTSNPKLLNSRKRQVRFNARIKGLSDFLGDMVARPSTNVANTAPATSAAGAPRLAHHSHVLKMRPGSMGWALAFTIVLCFLLIEGTGVRCKCVGILRGIVENPRTKWVSVIPAIASKETDSRFLFFILTSGQ